MSRKGIRYRSAYNLRSRGSRRTFECLPTPSGSPTRPRSSTTIQGLDGLRLPAGRSTYDTTRQAILDGVPVDVLCHLVLLEFVHICADMAEAVYDEQQRIVHALQTGASISDNESKLFHPIHMQHVKELLEIADAAIHNLEHRRDIPTAFWDSGLGTSMEVGPGGTDWRRGIILVQPGGP
ncbi:hypothetical protein EDD15DRAFT_2192537 [Pisolithus albus]|nr:hypothetical protein EDD15DRAFT_2200350 [Pisolithus albus]KAI6001750.1 hypothetical protein EDD15DRAFT_2192522 [Pisolithus albus]KAI6001768.1 hypothetical protein EDD15DRAFT_2192537 [Pisolithus albus]